MEDALKRNHRNITLWKLHNLLSEYVQLRELQFMERTEETPFLGKALFLLSIGTTNLFSINRCTIYETELRTKCTNNEVMQGELAVTNKTSDLFRETIQSWQHPNNLLITTPHREVQVLKVTFPNSILGLLHPYITNSEGQEIEVKTKLPWSLKTNFHKKYL